MKLIKTLGLTLAAVGMMSVTAKALPIVGSISFSGNYSPIGATGSDLTTATAMAINTIVVVSADGDLTGAEAWTFAQPTGTVGVNGNQGSLVGTELWKVTVGGVPPVFQFFVQSVLQITTHPQSIGLIGTGYMTRNGLDATDGQWQLNFGASSVPGSPASFSWQASTAVFGVERTPDGGGTLILLGSSLVGLFGIARKSLRIA